MTSLLRKLRLMGMPEATGAPVRSAHGFASVARTHEGAVRKLNEDRFVDMPEAGLWAVADGMGGHEAGDIAAQMTVDALKAAVPEPAAVHQAIAGVNARLLQRVAEGGPAAMSGSTLVALLAEGGRYTCLWAGDSRAYVLRAGTLIPISHDHSLVQELVDAGLVSAAEARVHPRSNVITRAVGVADEFLLDAATGPIDPGDLFLLCSDGLTSALLETEIAICLGDRDLTAAADTLLAVVLARHPRDNVTFVLIQPEA